MFRAHSRTAFAASLVLLLATCDGSDGSSLSSIEWPVAPAAVRSLTGAQPPDFSSAEVESSLNALEQSIDTVVGDGLLLSEHGIDEVAISCDGGVCKMAVAGVVTDYFTVGELFDHDDDDSIQYQAVATARGVSLYQERGRVDELEGAGYGGWLEHSGFGFFVASGEFTSGDPEGGVIVQWYSFGDATGTNSTGVGSTTWNGVMVGVDVSDTESFGNVIQGDAAIVMDDLSGSEVDIGFTNIHDLGAGTSRADMSREGIQAQAGGFTDVDGTIEGRFYGPGHEEVGGIFHRGDIFGAFGATRQ